MKSFTMYKLFILCSFLLTIIHHVSSTSLPYFMRSVENPHPDFSFSKMVRYTPTGYLYVGATNYLYKISPNLTIEIEKKIGPELDNPNCIHLDQNCLQKTMHDSYIKAMVIADSENVLIVCTSLFQGRCWKRHLSNLTRSGDDIETPVVANNKTATTVIFIAPGPSDSGVRNVMYVGASWTNTGLKAVRDLVPAFSSRQIWNFSYTFGNFYRKSYMKLDEPHRDSFPIWYIYGFSSNNFSYMATIQKRDTHAENFISKLIRVCQNDSKFYSYAESELRCSYNGNVYNLLQAAYVGKPGSLLAKSLKIPSSEDVLFGMFALGTPNAFTPPKESVLCIFPMWEVIKVFTLNIKKCFEGIGNIGPDHLVNPTNCQESEYSSTIDDNYCGAYRIDNPINGPDPVQAEAYLAVKDSSSSLIVTSPDTYTVAFVGTITGHIKKIAIESRAEMRQYEDLTVEQGFKIHQDMHLDTDEQHLYLLTDNKLHKIAVQNCSQYTDCASCTGARDPYCGWCSLEKKCSLKTECARNDEPLRWLGYHGESCTNITAVVPDKIQKDNKQSKATTLSLNITNLPSYNGPYKCAFTGYGSHFETPARREGPDLITCDTPAPNELPRFQTGEDHIIMKLSVVINGSDFVSTNFTFFDCEVHSQDSCYKCTASIFNCTWCIKNHHCSHYPLEDCSANDVFISGQNSAGLSIPHTPGPPSCPRIEASTTLILIPSGNTKNVTVSGVNLRDFQTPIRCYFSLNSGKTVNAHYGKMGNNKDLSFIVCNEVEFFYPEDTKYWNVPFKILWGDKNPKPLDNPDNMQVKMYKCEKMANSCGECLTQRSLYTCGWCGGQENKCSLKSSCDKKENWLSYLQNCPNPIIHSIQPTSGPKEGGTLLTIKGKDLGKTYQDIVSNVDIAGVQCSPIRDDYVASVRIVCITGKMLIDGERSGHVRVTVAQEYTATSYQKFTYVNPAIQGRSPEQGPVSGGTEITLYGSDMNAGTQRKVFFKNNYGIEDHECKIIKESVTASQLKCVTSKVNNTGRTGYLYMTFDKQTVYSTLHFEYIKDPNITKVQRKMAIVSGGIQVIAEGTGLSTIQRPKIILYYGTTVYEGDCMTRNDTLLECSSPQVDSYVIPATKYDSGIQLHFGFILDNVEEVRNLSRRPSFGNFTIYPDPDFTQFPGKVKSIQKKTEFLIIGGNYLNKGVMQQDIKVRIGKGTCNITNYGTQLTCRPPKDQPASLRNSRYPEVEIDVGNNLTIFIGYLRYEETEFPLPLEYIILICAGGGVLLISVVVVIIMYTMKTKKNDSMMKRMQIQMDNLEAKVAKECKEAFAELQTDMTELTSDLYGQVAIPFWDYRTYCMRVLFPQEQDTDHPVIKDLEVDYSRRDSVEKGLKLFSQLINNKTFLLIFVRTLEGHKQFTMRDRVNVASLISVALQTKMEYATDILKTLLAELIEKSVEGKNHPKLLLRRTESVAEKMLTNWFTFLLYKFLRECAGDPLFMLYQAIKHQVAKGPVDSCTSEARYSLSEDKLIRQQLDYRQMTIYVQDMDQFGQSPHPVKVLDCDTISQVKEKILDAMYKNAPFSSRPVKEDVDLVLLDQCTPNNTEWNSGIKGRLILQDDDNTTRVEGEYKRMNTLAHYKVPDSAFMTLVPKQPPSYNSLSLTSSEKSTSRFYVPEKFLPHHTRSPSFQRTVAPQGVHVDIVDNYGVKYYHLVKQHDNETNREGDRGSKMVSEIYLTRLLATKGTLQQFVDDLFERIFSTAHRGTALPLAIKYMFDFLDDQALLHNIMEADVVHTWKSNSLPLRFWVNVIKNPNFVFDIYKSNIVDSCLSVVAQTFMDSCSMSEHRLGKDSPSSKLLYAKDIPKYKKWVERYYQDIKMMPAISDQDMTAMMAEESRQHSDEFNTTASLYELYKYVQKYSSDLFSALEDDEFAKKNRLTYKLEQVRVAMESELYC